MSDTLDKQARKAWAEISENLNDRSIYDGGHFDRDLRLEIDAEQIAVIRRYLAR